MSDSAASYPVNVLGVRKAAGWKGFPACAVLLFFPRGLYRLQLGVCWFGQWNREPAVCLAILPGISPQANWTQVFLSQCMWLHMHMEERAPRSWSANMTENFTHNRSVLSLLGSLSKPTKHKRLFFHLLRERGHFPDAVIHLAAFFFLLLD